MIASAQDRISLKFHLSVSKLASSIPILSSLQFFHGVNSLKEPAHSEVFLKLTMYIAATVIMAPTSCTGEKVSPRYRNLKYQSKMCHRKILSNIHKPEI